MQISDNQKKRGIWLLRIIIFVVCLWYLITEIDDRWQFSFESLADKWLVILGVTLLVLPNWWLEIKRWQYSLSKLSAIEFRVAAKQVLIGTALNWVMPFTIGDALARLLPNTDRKKVAMLLIYNRVIMLILTALLGAYGVYTFYGRLYNHTLIALAVTIMLILFVIGVLKRIMARELALGLWLLKLSLYSLIRYVVFTLQFFLLIRLFNPELSNAFILAGIGWVFLARSILPSFLGHLGVREASALLFFSSMITDPMSIVLPSILIWIINGVLPGLAGAILLIQNKKPRIQ